jgi:hypothetical protein
LGCQNQVFIWSKSAPIWCKCGEKVLRIHPEVVRSGAKVTRLGWVS